MPDYSSDVVFLQTTYPLIGPLYREIPETTSGHGKLSAKGPLVIFLLFERNIENRTILKGPFVFFRHCATFRLFYAPKGIEFFSYFATECMVINREGSAFYIFRHYAAFSKEKHSKISFFSQKKCFALFEP